MIASLQSAGTSVERGEGDIDRFVAALLLIHTCTGKRERERGVRAPTVWDGSNIRNAASSFEGPC